MSPRRLVFAAAAIVTAGPAVASEGLVRIEPRPYYGAVVTVEHGVRVYRPLPRETLTIINPNQTPVNLSFSRSIEYKAGEASGDSGGDSGGGGDGRGGGARYGGIGGLGNDIAGTGIQRNRNSNAHGVAGLGTAKARHHLRRYVRK